jgi:amino acid adenylation domain-containing protein
VLTHLRQQGPSLQEGVAALANRAADRLREIILCYQVPLHLAQFSSLMHLTVKPEFKWGGLLFYLLRERGIHIWENRVFVFTTAHTEEDVDLLVSAFESSLAELAEGDLLPKNSLAAAVTGPQVGRPAESPTSSGADTANVATSFREFPLTESQKEIWLASLLGDNAARAYVITFTLDLNGDLVETALKSSLQTWIQRHDALRTYFDTAEPLQRIASAVVLPWKVEDRFGLDPKDRKCVVHEISRCQSEEKLDLTQPPLLRTQLVRFSNREHVLILTYSHLVADGWSVGALFAELPRLYRAECGGISAALEVPLQFAQYARLLEVQRRGDVFQRAEAFWRKQFTTLPQALELPRDRRRSAERSFRAARFSAHWPAEFSRALKSECARQRCTLLTYLLASFNALLYRLSGQSDIVVGVAAAGQISQWVGNVPGNRSLVGHCVNLLPVRTTCDGDAPFSAHLRQVKKTVLDAFDHQDLGFGRLIQLLHVPREAGREPLISVIFNLDRIGSSVPLEGLETKLEEFPRSSLVFDLSVNVTDRESEIQVDWDYSSDLFDASTVQRWSDHFYHLLQHHMARPEDVLSQGTLLTEAARRQLLEDWNTADPGVTPQSVVVPRLPTDGDSTLSAAFAIQAAQTPSAPAVTCNGESLTYRELNERANGLAHYLQSLGVGPDVLVGVVLDRGFDLVVALLAIVKAGGAYLPLDLTYPPDRIAFILKDASVPVILSDSTRLQRLPANEAKVVAMDVVRNDAAWQSRTKNPTSAATADHLAYVIYTSGTTGYPKGSLISHRNVVRLFSSTEPLFEFSESDVWTLFHSYAFDFSVWELWGALLYGGRLVVVPYEVSRSPRDFCGLLVKEKVTVLNQTPPAFQQLIQFESTGVPQISTLRYVILGGEALEIQSLQPWFDRHGDLHPQIVNMYGITETTVHVTHRRIRKDDLILGSVIGTAIPDLQIYILDPRREPVPIGVAGELYVGGPGLARGYLNRQDLTNERFVPNPFTADGGSCLYRTGDMARWLPTRDIEYLGRCDQQVKVRGFRIELSEIESILCQHPSVRMSTVVVREDAPGEKRLVAYVVASSGDSTKQDIKEYLRRKLPQYMVPALFVFLDRLPLTANGKIDRKALPSPSGVTTTDADSDGFLQTETERKLAKLWQRYLVVGQVGPQDNFFDLGGDSLLAVRLFSAIEKELMGKHLPLVSLFKAPTLRELARLMDGGFLEAGWRSLVSIKSEGSLPPFYCVHGIGGNILEFEHFSRYIEADQPLFGIQAQGLDGKSARHHRVEDMATHYLKEIRQFQPQGPYYLGGSSFGGLVAYEMAQQLLRLGETVGILVMFDTWAPDHPRYLPKTTALQRRLNLLRFQFELHLSNLRVSHGPGRRQYVKAKAGRLYSRLRQRWIGWNRKVREIFHPKATRAVRQSGFEALQTYVPSTYPGKVTLLRAMEQPRGIEEDYTNGWAGMALGGVEVYDVAGHHGSMMREPRARGSVEKLTHCLRLAHSRDPRLRPPLSSSHAGVSPPKLPSFSVSGATEVGP